MRASAAGLRPDRPLFAPGTDSGMHASANRSARRGVSRAVWQTVRPTRRGGITSTRDGTGRGAERADIRRQAAHGKLAEFPSEPLQSPIGTGYPRAARGVRALTGDEPVAGGIAVLRIDTVRHMTVHLADHLKGINRPATAQPAPPLPVVDPHVVVKGTPTVLGLSHSFKCDVPGAGEAVRESRNSRKRRGQKGGRPPNEAVMILLAGPPAYGTLAQWPDDMELKWAKASDAWARKVFGDGPVFVSCLHRDEKSPHLHVTGVPLCDGRISWNARLAELLPGVAARDRYRALQDSYHSEVGKRFGLARGVPGSKAVHTKPQRQKDDEQAALEAKKTRARLEAESDTLETKLVDQRAESKVLADAIAAGEKGWRGKAKARGLAMIADLAKERAGRKTERERADAAEKDVRRLTGELNRAIESMQRISEYVIGKMREHVERSYSRVAGVGIVHQAMADTLEWSREKFAPGWEPEAVVQTRERERQAAAHDAPAVHQGRDQGSGL